MHCKNCEFLTAGEHLSNSLINEKMRVNFQLFLERDHLAFLTP